jgi:NAD(P)-dependent dehydrogenase (short-subunit alcohol dehydrogenase family)
MDLELEGKTALVTGGSKGIGKAVARELAHEGAEVVICARTEAPLQAAAQELSIETGRRVVPIVADTSITESVEQLARDAVQALGHIDILVNNAAVVGGVSGSTLASTDEVSLLADIDNKVMGYLRCARALAPQMAERGWGRIINLGGMAVRQSGSYGTGMRNAAVVHLSKTLSDELGPSGITVNTVHPRLTRTEALVDYTREKAKQQGVTVEELEWHMAQANAIRRLIQSEEIAYLVAFLASPKATAITGEAIGAGGGSDRTVTY